MSYVSFSSLFPIVSIITRKLIRYVFSPRWRNTIKHFVIVLIDTNLPRRLGIYMYVYTFMYIFICVN